MSLGNFEENFGRSKMCDALTLFSLIQIGVRIDGNEIKSNMYGEGPMCKNTVRIRKGCG